MKNGFTLIELIVVIVIVATIAGFALVNYSKSYEQAYEGDAVTQLRAIHAANKIYYAKEYSYWPPNGASYDVSDINTNLGLNVMSNGFTYSCTGTDGSSYSCSAVRDGGGYTVQVQDTETVPGCCAAGSCPTLPGC